MVKNPSATQKTQETLRVWSLGWEDPPEEGMATHSNILFLENPIYRGAWWATVHRVAQSGTRLKWLSTHLLLDIYKCTARDFLLLKENIKPERQRPETTVRKNSNYRDNAGSWRKQQCQTPNLFISSRERKIINSCKIRTRCRRKRNVQQTEKNS